eukprot:COSAG03_NODE_9591_length_708_cov_0.885057_1_plen_190_part_10
MSSTQSQHPVDLHATTTYVDEFDCEDAVSEPYELQASRPQFLNSSGPTYSRAHPNATTPTPSHICEPVQCGELGGGQGPEVDFAQPAPAQIAHVEVGTAAVAASGSEVDERESTSGALPANTEAQGEMSASPSTTTETGKGSVETKEPERSLSTTRKAKVPQWLLIPAGLSVIAVIARLLMMAMMRRRR